METKEAGPRVGEEFGGRVRVFAVRGKGAGSMALTFQNTHSSDRPNACDYGKRLAICRKAIDEPSRTVTQSFG